MKHFFDWNTEQSGTESFTVEDLLDAGVSTEDEFYEFLIDTVSECNDVSHNIEIETNVSEMWEKIKPILEEHFKEIEE